MIITIKCNVTHLEKLKDFLAKDAVYNTFILADIDIYGFENDFQDIYMRVDKHGDCESVYLRFHNVLIVSGQNLDLDFVKEILKDEIHVIMGKDALIKQIDEKLESDYIYSSKNMYTLEDGEKLLAVNKNIEVATLKNVDEIYDFLQSIDNFKNMYKSKEMIENRIKSGEGSHLFLKKNGQIIAHANSAAESEYSTMIGGVATAEDSRGKNLAKEVVSALAMKILQEEKIPCTFSERNENHSLFSDIGFKNIGLWGTLEKTKGEY